MSRGIGATQRRILDFLAQQSEQDYGLTVSEIGTALGASPRQIRTALHSLEQRGLVLLMPGYIDWKGVGQYGRLRQRNRWTGDDPPANVVLEKGDPWPRGKNRIALRQSEFVYGGMPVRGLYVCLPERRQQYEEEREARWGWLLAAVRAETDVAGTAPVGSIDGQ